MPRHVENDLAVTRGVVYGVADGERLLLDLYKPLTIAGPRAAVVLIHGGGMWTGTRTDMDEPARELARAGFVAISIDYRLVDAAAGRNRWPAQLDDAQRAVRWIRANAGLLGVDSGRIAAYGWSAGGQLAALLGMRETRDECDPALAGFSSSVSCVVDLAGDIDLAAYTEPPARDEVIALLGGTYEEVPEQYGDASPLSWIDGATAPFLVMHGLRDDVVPVEQSRRLVAALQNAGVLVEFLEVPECDHHDLTWPVTGSTILGFLNNQLAHPERDSAENYLPESNWRQSSMSGVHAFHQGQGDQGMSAIWQSDGHEWRLLSPAGFPDEAALHSLVEQAPQTLPLAGNPNLIMVGREVLLGGNYADLIAIEPSGRLAVIEIKLARNAEARRAVIAQILTYAAYLRGLDIDTLEREILSSHLNARGYASIEIAASANSQDGSFDPIEFSRALAANLAEGGFRLVIVLDDAPEELSRLVGHLEAVANKLVIDLVTVASYDISGSQVIVPTRIDHERSQSQTVTSAPSHSAPSGRYVEGASDFADAVQEAPVGNREFLQRMVAWACALENENLVKLGTYHGKSGRITLLPRVPGEGAGLITIYNERGPAGAYIQFWRSVIARRAPMSLTRIEQAAAPATVGQGNTTRDVSDELLDALTDAYREAATGRIGFDSMPLDQQS